MKSGWKLNWSKKNEINNHDIFFERAIVLKIIVEEGQPVSSLSVSE